MRLIILFLMFVFSCFSCSLKKKSSVEVVENKTETLKEEQKSEVQSVSNASTFVDSSKTLVYNDAVREVVETYKYTPPDSAGRTYVREYSRTTRDKQSNAKQVSNASAKSERQDSISTIDERKKNAYSETETRTKTKESVKSNAPILHYAITVALVAIAVIAFWLFWKEEEKRFLDVL